MAKIGIACKRRGVLANGRLLACLLACLFALSVWKDGKAKLLRIAVFGSVIRGLRGVYKVLRNRFVDHTWCVASAFGIRISSLPMAFGKDGSALSGSCCAAMIDRGE